MPRNKIQPDDHRDRDDRNRYQRVEVAARVKLDRFALELDVSPALKVLLERLIECTCRTSPAPGDGVGHTSIHVVAVELENQEEATVPTPDRSPDFSLPSIATQAVLAVVGPRKADGSYSSNGGFTTSDETTLPVEQIADSMYQQPDPAWVDPGDGTTAPLLDVVDEQGRPIPVYKCRAKTPLEPEPGQKVFGDVTWKGPGMVDAVVKVEYGDPALGHAVITGSVENEV